MTQTSDQNSSTDQLSELSERRQRWVDANAENQFADGIKNLLTELYPENAHFIYELLQNAEDAQASNVSFQLHEEYLVFEHNGSRPFTIKDIESITSIGVSTKKDDPTAIGKFGVGFKAVFAYTENPEIHSRNYHFRIRDLVVPDSMNVEKLDVGEITRFVFPFDHPKKSPQQASAEIERGLIELSDNTLLFLNNIDTLTFTLPDGDKGSLRRIPHDNRRIEIQITSPKKCQLESNNDDDTLLPGSNGSSHWLRFTDTVEILDPDENKKLKQCHIAIAFQLAKRTPPSKDHAEQSMPGFAATWKIMPVDVGDVSIYFPAVKEYSRCRFHMHAPFASTVARDSIRDCDVNDDLRDHIAELLAKSMTEIREAGLLSVNFLEVLPLPSDKLTSFYEPIRERLVSEFQNKSLTPTLGGKFKRASILRKGSKSITSRLGDEELAFLTNSEYLRWAANPNRRNSREDFFLLSLGIEEWGFSDLLLAASDEVMEPAKSWLEKQPNAWIRNLYARLNKFPRSHEAMNAVEAYPILRVKPRTHIHMNPDSTFLSASNQFDTYCDIVEPEVWNDPDAEAYLRSVGFDEFDLASEVETLILPKYEEGNPSVTFEEHLQDLEKIYQVRTELLPKVNIRIVLGENSEDGTSKYQFASQVYWKTDELQIYFDGNPDGWFISSEYQKHEEKWLVDLFNLLGVRGEQPMQRNTGSYKLKAVYRGGDHERGLEGFNPAWTIDGLEYALSHPTIERSAYIWNILLPDSIHLISGEVEYCTNITFPADRIESEILDSKAGTLLKSEAWIPLKSGQFVTANEIDSLEDLHPKLQKDEVLLVALDASRTSSLSDAADILELPLEIAEFVRNHLEDVRNLQLLIEKREANEQGTKESSAGNRERRRQKLRERRQEAPPKKSVKKMRSVPAYSRKEFDRHALYAFYHDDDDDVTICQMCCDAMPFVRRNGDEAIECIDLFSKAWAEKSNFELKVMTPLKLVLCPVCSEIYKEYVLGDLDKQDELLEELYHEEVSEFYVCPDSIRRDQRKTTVTFNQKHLGDIRDCLDYGEGGDSDQ